MFQTFVYIFCMVSCYYYIYNSTCSATSQNESTPSMGPVQLRLAEFTWQLGQVEDTSLSQSKEVSMCQFWIQQSVITVLTTDQANHTKKEGEPQFDSNKNLHRNDRTLSQKTRANVTTSHWCATSLAFSDLCSFILLLTTFMQRRRHPPFWLQSGSNNAGLALNMFTSVEVSLCTQSLNQ